MKPPSHIKQILSTIQRVCGNEINIILVEEKFNYETLPFLECNLEGTVRLSFFWLQRGRAGWSLTQKLKVNNYSYDLCIRKLFSQVLKIFW